MLTESLEKKLIIIREWLADYCVNKMPHNKTATHNFTYYEKYRRQYKDFTLRFDLWFSKDSISGFGLWKDGRPIDFKTVYDLMPTDLRLKLMYISEAEDE